MTSLLAFPATAQGDRAGELPPPAAGTRPAVAPSPEAELARSARLETILRVALERNRDLAENQARARAVEARSQAATRLPDLEAKYEQWGIPLARPYALDQANTLMLGVRQTFPAWGSLAARGRAAAEDAASAQDAARARRQEVAAQVRRTYASYYAADQELHLHLEHVGLTSRVLGLARLNQRTGHGSLQDILRLELELTRLHTDVARIERQQRSSRALLNALMDRPAEAPLGPPEDLSITPSTDITALERSIDGSRPEVVAAGRGVRRSEALLDGARRSARFPNIMVGLDYWYMPMFPDFHHAYGAMVAINLPWLSGRHQDEEREAEQTVVAERHAFESTRNTVRYELRDAAARVDSARQSFTVIDQDLLAQARRSLEATQAAYAAGQGDAVGMLDALRSYLQVRIERVRALAELASSQTDLERAAGLLAAEGSAR
ncbi:MAG TPA: TolC family protein [Polyangia bacterium]|nr:TolC family protein [Polyangia bacterium]